MDSKILEVDKDEWIYHSMKRYSNLYMFELEFPVDAIEIIDDTSICLSGIQEFSKKCEILQLSIPPKLLTKDMEEGLCKDRDFNMISGGYASDRILQIKPIKSFPSFVMAVESGQNGITMFKLGDENCAVLKEQSKLFFPKSATSEGKCPGVIDTHCNRILMGASNGKSLYEWKLDNDFISSSHSNVSEHILSPSKEDSLYGGIVKIKFWDENSVTFCTDKGVICVHDLRSGKPFQDGIVLFGTKSPLSPSSFNESSNIKLETESQAGPSTSEVSTPQILQQPISPVFSFDTIQSLHKIGMVDSYGGYETFDVRNVSSGSGGGSAPIGRTVVPGFEKNSGIIGQRFNIEYEPVGMKKENINQFVLTGLREESVQVIREDNSGIKSVFIHDGHSKTVTHALWHPISERLVFSASIDSMLHAWQFNCECDE